MARPKASKGAAGSEGSGSGSVARSSKRAAKTGNAVSALASARLGLLSGLIEGTLAIMELMVGISLSRFVALTAYKTFNTLEADQQPPPWNMFCITIASNIVVFAWQIYRLSQKSQPVCSQATMADRLNLWPLPRSIGADSRSMLLLVFCLHAVGTAGMFLMQYMTGTWLFSWQNYWNEERGWDYNTAVDMLVLAPLREELTFRGLMFSIFYLRGAAFKVAAPEVAVAEGKDGAVVPAAAATPAHLQESLAWTSSWKWDCVLASAVTFGLVHLLNLFGARYTKTYIILQVLLGMVIGAFYCLRFVQSEATMLEPVLLHIINNFFSSFLPIEADLDLSSPLVSFPLMLTFAVYGTLAYREYKKLMASPPTPFTVLLPNEVPAPAAAAPVTAAPAIEAAPSAEAAAVADSATDAKED